MCVVDTHGAQEREGTKVAGCIGGETQPRADALTRRIILLNGGPSHVPAAPPAQKKCKGEIGEENVGREDLNRHVPSVLSFQLVLDEKTVDDEIEHTNSDRTEEVHGPTMDVADIGGIGEHRESEQDDENPAPSAKAHHAPVTEVALQCETILIGFRVNPSSVSYNSRH